ncbi:MAG TPA: amino acid adenylation domain-containing protein [Gemmatimonadaceae bacterium]|nr:amino acid adenylation domain-containing protein [Gemmatimonadaceae bacterium]
MTNLWTLLETSAAKSPERVAVEDAESDTSISYADLVTSARALTEVMVRRGLRPGDRVGICAPKSISSVIALFAALGGRAAYVPVDAGAPPPRNAGIFADCSIAMAVVASDLVEGLMAAWDGPPLAVLEDLDRGLKLIGPERSAETAVDSSSATIDEVAYILYTSGSTGKPKGVVHTHRSALSFIDWCSAIFSPTTADRFSSHAPFHFDLSILDIYVPLKHGATLVLIGEDLGKQPLRLAPAIADRRISVWYSTPSILRLLTEYGKLEKLEFPALRLVLFAGEVFPVKHLRALKKHWNGPRYFNLYGPTETNVCTYYEIPQKFPDDRTEPFPIGFVCSDDRAMVVDEDDAEVSPSEQGELVITGGSVMREYWNLPERSAKAFLVDSTGVRWYRTGDVVTESPNDGYIFVGRRDRMVKRRGYRVELGEIEAALYRHPRVTEAAVTSVSTDEKGVIVNAFITMADGSRPSLVEMKRFCTEQLPAYMIPDRFIFPESLPKTSTDKIDYQKLRELA